MKFTAKTLLFCTSLGLLGCGLGCGAGAATPNPQQNQPTATQNQAGSGSGSSAASSSGQASATTYQGYDSAHAWSLLNQQVELGPRPSGSAASTLCKKWIVRELKSAGLEAQLESFEAKPPTSSGFEPTAMNNVFADLPATTTQSEPHDLVVLSAHYDTKRWTPKAPADVRGHILGANDGASGVTLLLELARVLAKAEHRPVDYRIVFFDGEEAFRWSWMDPDNCYGSRHHAAQMRADGSLARTKAMLLFDMIADKQLSLINDLNSNPQLRSLLRKTVSRLGLNEIMATGPGTYVSDDHLSFRAYGIPVLDMIDLHYPDRDNAYWHTGQDTLEHVSEESLDKMGRVATALLRDLEAGLSK